LTGMRNLLSPHAMPAVSLLISTCSHRLCLPGWGDGRACHSRTRLIGMRNLLSPHAPLHPIDGIAEPVIAARAAGGRPARQHMLAQAVPARLGKWRNLPFAHAIDGNAKPAAAARIAGGQPARQHMLTQTVPISKSSRGRRRKGALWHGAPPRIPQWEAGRPRRTCRGKSE